jgi:hypothetical protein
MSDFDADEKIERTDTGVSISVQLKRGEGTRDEDRIKAKAKGATLEDAREDMDELRDYLRGLAEECRAIQPGGDVE